LFRGGRRWFWTQQHGDNFLFDVIPAERLCRGSEDASN
jgi:hypothetical protein